MTKQKNVIKKSACMKFYDEKELQYFGTDASGTAFGAGLLQIRDGVTCPRDTAPDNSRLRPVAFARKAYPVLRHAIAT